jgi:dienelactone hydrolase
MVLPRHPTPMTRAAALPHFGRVLLGVAFGLALVANAAAASAQAIGLTAGDVGAPLSGAAAELYRPPGSGPFPAVVVLHGCNGVGPHDRRWAQLLSQWGYVALLIDSFRPRGFTEVCNRGRLVPPEARAADAFAGMRYLATLSYVRAGRIGLIGFSHGGWAVLKTVLADAPRPADLPPFAAAVAFYPACAPPGAPLQTDTLILIGEADDWTPALRCVRWRELAQTGGHALMLKTYPGALHAFDQLAPPHDFAGHHVGREPQAAEDATAQTRAFLAARLMAP